MMRAGLVDKAKRALIPIENIREIEEDAAWNPTAKRTLQSACPRVAAKYLNKTGISAEHQDLAVLLTAAAAIGVRHMALLRRLDEIAAKTNPPAAAAPPAGKPQETKP